MGVKNILETANDREPLGILLGAEVNPPPPPQHSIHIILFLSMMPVLHQVCHYYIDSWS